MSGDVSAGEDEDAVLKKAGVTRGEGAMIVRIVV